MEGRVVSYGRSTRTRCVSCEGRPASVESQSASVDTRAASPEILLRCPSPLVCISGVCYPTPSGCYSISKAHNFFRTCASEASNRVTRGAARRMGSYPLVPSTLTAHSTLRRSHLPSSTPLPRLLVAATRRRLLHPDLPSPTPTAPYLLLRLPPSPSTPTVTITLCTLVARPISSCSFALSSQL